MPKDPPPITMNLRSTRDWDNPRPASTGRETASEKVAEVCAISHREGREAGIREALEGSAAIVALWQRPSHVRLYAGEMSAQEMRSVQAVLGAISRAIGDLAIAPQRPVAGDASHDQAQTILRAEKEPKP